MRYLLASVLLAELPCLALVLFCLFKVLLALHGGLFRKLYDVPERVPDLAIRKYRILCAAHGAIVAVFVAAFGCWCLSLVR